MAAAGLAQEMEALALQAYQKWPMGRPKPPITAGYRRYSGRDDQQYDNAELQHQSSATALTGGT